MAATKECPSCGTEVPTIAPRCKVCFHDFNEAPPPRSMGPLVLLAAFTTMAVVAAVILAYVAIQPVDRAARINYDSQSIVFVTKYRTSQETLEVAWSRVTMVEHVTTSGGDYIVNAVLLDGSRMMLAEGDAPLRVEAQDFADKMHKPLEAVDNTRAGIAGDGAP